VFWIFGKKEPIVKKKEEEGKLVLDTKQVLSIKKFLDEFAGSIKDAKKRIENLEVMEEKLRKLFGIV